MLIYSFKSILFLIELFCETFVECPDGFILTLVKECMTNRCYMRAGTSHFSFIEMDTFFYDVLPFFLAVLLVYAFLEGGKRN